MSTTDEIDTEITIEPPDVATDDGDGDDDRGSVRIQVQLFDTRTERGLEVAVQLYAEQDLDSPDAFARTLIDAALGCAMVRGADFAWAVSSAFAAYDGTRR